MNPKYKNGFIKNIFKQLDDESSLCLIGICLASNDIILCAEQLDKFGDEEKTYFFAISLSILREVAKIISKVDNLTIKNYFSKKSNDLFENLKNKLLPFHEETLTKGTLKPVRDHIFHYDFLKSRQYKKLISLLYDTKKEKELKIRIDAGAELLFSHRFTFADIFRNEFVNSFLSEDLATTVSTISVNIVDFTDSLLADLIAQ
jgi:hypothetical protein